MNDNVKNIDDLLNKIDNVKLIDEKELDNMDFYELCYYMQNLNIIDSLDGDDQEEGDL